MIYSPLPFGSYKTLKDMPLQMLEEPSVWNLYYLSEPRLDETKSVSEGFPSEMQILWACEVTCKVYPSIEEALLNLSAEDAVKFIQSQNNFKQLPIYELLGARWLETARDRMRHKPPRGILVQNGNVLSVNFGGHFLSLPKSNTSAILMPMSYDKH